MSLGRRTRVEVIWMSVPITDDIAPHLLGLTYTDNLSGAADDLSLELEDRDGLWSGNWRPTFGDSCRVSWEAEGWLTGVDKLDTGVFAHDKIALSGPPGKATIQAVSAPLSTGLRRRKRTRGWSGMNLFDIAGDIAMRADMRLSFEGPDGAAYKRKEQKNKSDLEFLEDLCKEAGYGLKVTDGQIAIFEEYTREKTRSVGELDLLGGHVKSWNFDGDDSQRYGACRVTFFSPEKGKKVFGEFKDPVNTDGQTLEVTHAVEDKADAERLAKALLRNANRFATSGRITTLGDPGLVAGVVFDLVNARSFDGRFIVTKAEHHPIGGYTTTLTVRRCLEGY